MESRYSLRLAVKLHAAAAIAKLSPESTIEIDSISVRVKQRDLTLVLQASPFTSELEAERFLPKLKGGLWNMALEHDIAFTPFFERRFITRAPDPRAAAKNLAEGFGMQSQDDLAPVHGLTEEEGYTIFKTDENIKFLAFGGASRMSTTDWNEVSRSLDDGMRQAPQQTEDCEEENLSTAINLYLSNFYETSIRARFLTLMMVLEVLAPATQKHPVAIQLLRDLQAEIDSKLATEVDQDVRNALESLRKETEFRRETSIRRRVRRLVLDEVPLNEMEREALAKKVVAAYDLRGSVVHTGSVDFGALVEANNNALVAVKLLLRKRLGLAAGPRQLLLPGRS